MHDPLHLLHCACASNISLRSASRHIVCIVKLQHRAMYGWLIIRDGAAAAPQLLGNALLMCADRVPTTRISKNFHQGNLV
jgi:hypothetical protein